MTANSMAADRWRAAAKRVKSISPSTTSFLSDSSGLSEGAKLVFEEVEKQAGVSLDQHPLIRKEFLSKYSMAAANSPLLELPQVETLIASVGIAVHQSVIEQWQRKRMTELEALKSDNGIWNDDDTAIDGLDLRDCVSLLVAAIKHAETAGQESEIHSTIMTYFPLEPESLPKQAWDLLCMSLLMYCSFAVPYGIAFVEDDTASMGPQGIADLAINMIFMLDIALSFVTIVEIEGKLLRDINSISLHYLQTWFVPDFAGSFPFDTVVEQVMGSGAGNLSAMRLIRMIKLVRAAKFIAKLNKLKEREGYESLGSLFGVSTAVFILFFTSHIFGCLFMMLANAEDGENWLLHYRPEIADADGLTQYVTALYWAVITITTMGYGDIYPVTQAERLFLILVALVGAVVFSYCLGTISSLITEVAGIDDKYRQRLRTVQEYLQFRFVPPDLKRRTRRFFHRAWKKSPAPYDELAILAEFPPPIRAAVLRAIGERSLPDLPLLRGFGPECVGFLVTRLAPVALDAVPGECVPIYRRGDRADAMYFVVDGEVELALDPPGAEGGAAPAPAEARVAGKGDTFGELALFPDLAGPLRLDSATARGPVTALALGPAQLADVADAYPEVARRLRELGAALAADARARARGAPPPAPALAAAGEEEAGGAGPVGCGIAARVRLVRKELVDRLERDLLLPAAAPGAAGGDPAVLRLLLLDPPPPPARRPPAAAGAHLVGGDEGRAGAAGREGGARGASCVVSGDGEVLVVEHTPEGVAAAAPVSLGRVVPGRPALRVLDGAWLHGGGGGGGGGGGVGERFACQCALRLTRRAAPPSPSDPTPDGAAGCAGAGEAEVEEVEVVMALRTREDLDCLARLLDTRPVERLPSALSEPELDVIAGHTDGGCGPGATACLPGPGGPRGGDVGACIGYCCGGRGAAAAAEGGRAALGGAGANSDDSDGWAAQVLRAEAALHALRRSGPGPPADPGLAAAIRALARAAAAAAPGAGAPADAANAGRGVAGCEGALRDAVAAQIAGPAPDLERCGGPARLASMAPSESRTMLAAPAAPPEFAEPGPAAERPP